MKEVSFQETSEMGHKALQAQEEPKEEPRFLLIELVLIWLGAGLLLGFAVLVLPLLGLIACLLIAILVAIIFRKCR